MAFSGKLRHTLTRAGQNHGAAPVDRVTPSASSAMFSNVATPVLIDAEERDLPWEDSDVTTDDDVAFDTLTPDQFDAPFATDPVGDVG